MYRSVATITTMFGATRVVDRQGRGTEIVVHPIGFRLAIAHGDAPVIPRRHENARVADIAALWKTRHQIVIAAVVVAVVPAVVVPVVMAVVAATVAPITTRLQVIVAAVPSGKIVLDAAPTSNVPWPGAADGGDAIVVADIAKPISSIDPTM